MTIVKMSAAQQAICDDAYHRGYAHATNSLELERKKFQQDKELAKLETMKAATALLQEASKMMSRAGYMLGKANGSTGW